MKKFLFLLIFTIGFSYSNAQIFDKLKEKAGEIGVEAASKALSSPMSKLITQEAITTNFNDCNKKDIKDPSFANDQSFKELCNDAITSKGILLEPGYYSFTVKSFCLHAGTYAPGKGDGYLYAPLKGPKRNIINTLVKGWYKNQDITQSDVQSLIWAILAKTNFKNLDSKLQGIAARLLSSSDVKDLSLGLDFITDDVLDVALKNAPELVKNLIEAENKIRNIASNNGTFSQLESVAILSGVNPNTSSQFRYGVWGLHPQGFWIAYEPSGYSKIRVKIYVPKTAVHYIPSNDVAVPANIGSQRLLLSDIIVCK